MLTLLGTFIIFWSSVAHNSHSQLNKYQQMYMLNSMPCNTISWKQVLGTVCCLIPLH